MPFRDSIFVKRYGSQQAKRPPPIRRMLEMGIPWEAGTAATRVSSYKPYLFLPYSISSNWLRLENHGGLIL